MKLLLFFLTLCVYLNAQKHTTYTQQVNNMRIDWLNNGVVDDGHGHNLDIPFMYSAGFGLSAIMNSEVRNAWISSADRIDEFRAGAYGATNTNSPIWIVKRNDTQGSQAFIDWAEAVALGAEYIDVDKNGSYDPEIDRPNQFGDEMFYMVVNDDVPEEDRPTDTEPMQIEVHINGFAFKQNNRLDDVIYLRFRLFNKSGIDMSDVYFTKVLDFDLGYDFQDDAIGCDTIFEVDSKNVTGLAFGWNGITNGTQDGSAFGTDIMQGPYIYSAGDTALVNKGDLGQNSVVGSKNLEMTSVYTYVGGDSPVNANPAWLGARRTMLGGLDHADGSAINPTQYGTGGLVGDNPKFLYSGDPVTNTGWVMNTELDRRYLQSVGPFDIPAGGSQELIVAWIFGRNDPKSTLDPNLSAIQELRRNDIVAQMFADNNFKEFFAMPNQPSIKVLERNDGGVDLLVDLEINGTKDFRAVNGLEENYRFGGIEIYQFKHSDLKKEEAHEATKFKLLGRFNVAETGWKLLAPQGNEVKLVWENGLKIDSDQKRIILSLKEDPLRAEAFRKGREYYFGARAFAYNETAYEKREQAEYTQHFISTDYDANTTRLTYGLNEHENSGNIDVFNENDDVVTEEHIRVAILEPANLTGENYTLNVYKTGSEELRYNVRNESKNLSVVDSARFFIQSQNDLNRWNADIYDGFQLHIVDTALLLNKTFKFNTGQNVKKSSLDYRKNALKRVKVVPNPFLGYHEGMAGSNDQHVMFTNLPTGDVTIRLFTVNGTYVGRIEKHDDNSLVKWDLKNARGKRVASGLYIAHISAKGVGDRTLKLYVFTDK